LPVVYIVYGGLRRPDAVRRSPSDNRDRVVRSFVRAYRDVVRMKQPVHLGDLALTALASEGERGPETALASRLVSVIRLYLNDRDPDRPGWPYPGFLPARGKIGEKRLELDVEEDLWRAFELEAGRQGVSVSQLASHAALYYAAELSSGRLTQGIADNLDGSQGGSP
jgi:hypothetical protein